MPTDELQNLEHNIKCLKQQLAGKGNTSQGWYAEAEPLYVRAIAIYQEKLG